MEKEKELEHINIMMEYVIMVNGKTIKKMEKELLKILIRNGNLKEYLKMIFQLKVNLIK